jgi:hypothetical protein
MDLPTVVEVDLGSSAWALGLCGLLALVVVCATCVVLALKSDAKAPDVLAAFADVLRAFRRRPRGRGGVGQEELASRPNTAA